MAQIQITPQEAINKAALIIGNLTLEKAFHEEHIAHLESQIPASEEDIPE
jgi:hypothetical protein